VIFFHLGGDISIKLHTKAGSGTPDMLGLNPKDEAPSILVIEDGQIKEEELRTVKKSKELTEDILYGEWSETDGFYIQPYPQTNSQIQ
jgi:uncharacterized membrane protein YcaP (DUF421 family)